MDDFSLSVHQFREQTGANRSVVLDGREFLPRSPELYVFPDVAELCSWVTAQTIQLLMTHEGGVILPTGNTPLPMYDLWNTIRSTLIPLFKDRNVAALDEHWPLYPEDEVYKKVGYKHYAEDHYTGPLEIPQHRFIIPDSTAEDPWKEAERIEHLLAVRKWLLAILGIGPDATKTQKASNHAGFIAPGASPLQGVMVVDQDDATRWANSNSAKISLDKYPSKAITMGPADIERALRKILLATTANKQQNLADVVTGPFDAEKSATHLLLMQGVILACTQEAFEETGRRLHV
jgi:6-phosphogluconolactonase/glucosamine-6-phosphate isomerase/deaminase